MILFKNSDEWWTGLCQRNKQVEIDQNITHS